MLPYPDSVAKVVQTPGEQDPITGLMTPGTETVVWEAACDVQDDSVRTATQPDGSQHYVSGARVYLPDTADLTGLQSSDRLQVEQTAPNGSRHERTAEVLEVRLFDQALTVKWL